MKIAELSRSAKQPTVADANRVLGPIVQKLEPIATSAAALDLCARFHMARGEAAEALALEKRALEVDPTCFNCLVMTAEIWNAQGDMQKGARDRHHGAWHGSGRTTAEDDLSADRVVSTQLAERRQRDGTDDDAVGAVIHAPDGD